MAASFIRNNLTLSSGTGLSSSRSASILDACSKPLRQRCEEIAYFIQKSTSKELHGSFQPLLDDIFGYNGRPGWGIHRLSQQASRDEYRALHAFLSPHGPLLQMVYRLQEESGLRYEFPVAKLPAPTRDAILEGAMPGFYANKLSYQTHGGLPAQVSLTAFEYFMYCFSYLIVFQHKQQSLQHWTDTEDWLYPCLLNDYLHYFLPTDGTSLPPVPFASSTQMSGSAQGHSPPYRLPQYGVLYHYLYSGDSQHGHLFRSNVAGSASSTMMHQQQQPVFNLSQVDCSGGGSRETWRSEVLLQALGEFLLGQNALQPKEQGFRQHVRENYIPSADHVRMVRILVKHLHFFVNSARPPLAITAYQQPEQDQLEDFKRYVIPQFIKKKLYVFLRHGFDNWPLDSTFRSILEVWLSYIQPWRYTEQMREAERSHAHMRDVVKDRPIEEERWLKFVSSNLLFYTVLFQEFLPRAFRQDLAVPKNAIVLLRVAKVFAQTNLHQVLKEAERRLVEGYHSPISARSGSLGSSFLSPHRVPSSVDLGSQLADLESPTATYQPLLSNHMRMSIEKLLQVVHQAHITVSNMNYCPPSTNNGEGFLSWLGLSDLTSAGGQGSYGQQLQDDLGPIDARKLSKYLSMSMDYLCKVFEVDPPALLENGTNRGASGGVNGSENGQPPHCINGELSPLGRKQMMNGLRKFDIVYRGDPELQPIRSFENAFLVRKLHKVSTGINNLYGDKIVQLYHQPDFVGAVARQFFTRSAVTPTHRHPQTPKCSLSFGPSPAPGCPGDPPRVRPRVSLRFLSSYYTLAKVAFLCLCLLSLGLGPVGVAVALLLLVALYGVVGGAVHSMRHGTQTDRPLD